MKVKRSIIIQEMGDTYIAYDNTTSTIHELNETAFFILKKIKKREAKDRIIENIVKAYEIKQERAQKDFEKFLGVLKEKGLISDRG